MIIVRQYNSDIKIIVMSIFDFFCFQTTQKEDFLVNWKIEKCRQKNENEEQENIIGQK